MTLTKEQITTLARVHGAEEWPYEGGPKDGQTGFDFDQVQLTAFALSIEKLVRDETLELAALVCDDKAAVWKRKALDTEQGMYMGRHLSSLECGKEIRELKDTK